jgi:hypothetical protein
MEWNGVECNGVGPDQRGGPHALMYRYAPHALISSRYIAADHSEETSIDHGTIIPIIFHRPVAGYVAHVPTLAHPHPLWLRRTAAYCQPCIFDDNFALVINV